MSSRSRSDRPSRRSQPPVASGSRSRNQENMERRRQSTRGRSRSRSPRDDQRWASIPQGGWHAPPASGRARSRNRSPPRMSRQRSSYYQREDGYERREAGRESRDRHSRSPAVGRRRAERQSESSWRRRARSSPPAETMSARRRSRNLSPPGYHTREGRSVWQEQGGQGGGMHHAYGGRRSQSSDVSMRSRTPPSSRRHDEHESMGGGEWDYTRGQPTPRSRDRAGQYGDVSYRNEREDRGPCNNNPRTLSQGDETHSFQNYGTTYNIGNAENVFTGSNSGIVYMGSVTEDFMRHLSDRLKICIRADHRYYAPDDEANLRRGQCTPGTHVNILQGITHWASNISPNSEQVFWLSGQAGTGKTTIAYTVAHHLEALAGDGNNKVVLGASFFCSRQFPDTRSPSSIIRTLVHQLAVRSKSFRIALQEHGSFDTVDHGPRSQIMGLLITPWERSAPERSANSEPCFVISIDALDELEGTGGTEFLGILFDFVDQQGLSGLKFFVTSRSDPALVKRIESFPNKKVYRLEEVLLEESSADIKVFLDQNLAQCATAEQIHQLVLDAAGLFIHAATVVEYLKGRDVEEQKSLLRRLMSSSSARRPSRATATLDNLYLQILETSLVDPRERDDLEVFQECLSILHTFLCTIERTSISVAIDVLNASSRDGDALLDDGIAHGVLHRLHAVLYSQGGHVMLYHKSFADFLFDKGRSQRFFCSQERHHHRLAAGCFGIMARQLRFNIANIPTSCQMDCDNPTLPASIESNISAPLRYACGNWSAHLTLTSIEALDDLIEALHEFLQLQVLFWMEVMNLVSQRGRCQGMLRDAQQWASRTKAPMELPGKLADAAMFSGYHDFSKAALSTPHLYLSSLATFPGRSVTVKNWRQQFCGIPGFTGALGVGKQPAVTCINVKGLVHTLAVSPGGVNVVVVTHVDWTGPRLVRIWDLLTGEEVGVLKGPTDSVCVVAYSPDGTRIVSGDTSVRVWDSSTGEEVGIFKGHTDFVRALAYSPDGSHIAFGSDDHSVRVWDVSTGGEGRVLLGHTGEVTTVAYSPDGTRIVSGSEDTSIRVWDPSTGEEVNVFKGHTDKVREVAYSPDGTRIFSVSDDKSARVWGMSIGGEAVILKGHPDVKPLAVAFSPDRTHLVAGFYKTVNRSVRMWALSTGEEVSVPQGHTGWVEGLAYLQDGKHVVSGSTDKSVRVWDLSPVDKEETPKGHTDSVNAVAYSPDGTHVVSGSQDKSVRLWDLSTGEEVQVLMGHTGLVATVACSPDGSHVISGSWDTSIRMWDLSTGEHIRVFQGPVEPYLESVQAVAYLPDGTRVLSGLANHSVRVWDVPTGQQVRVAKGYEDAALAVAFSLDRTHVVSGFMNKLVRVWDLLTGEEVRVLKGHTMLVSAVAYSPDGTCVASGSSDTSVRVWDLSTGEVMILEGHTNEVKAVAFSPDGAHVASGSLDKSVRVWELSTGEVRVLRGHADYVRTLAYSPGGTHIVSGSDDRSIRVWDISPGHTPRYVREQGKDEEYTGWLLSPTDSSAYLMFVRPDVLLPDDYNVLTLPTTAVPHIDFSYAKLGDRWAECYTPTLL